MAGRLSLRRLVEVLSSAPAQRYGLSGRKGSISVGKDADLVLFDPHGTWRVRGRNFLSQGKVTPFEGMQFRGRVVKTLLRGRVIFDLETGIRVDPGYGRWISRKDH
jgi:dihydroorotase-like cyclic amidohydrolase